MKKLGELFKSHGFELYEVGGSVRDSMLGRESNDRDFTTDARPDSILMVLKELEGGSVYEIGKEFGTIGYITEEGEKIEITTYRSEVYPSESRKPVVEFGMSLEQDLSRRDFTINAIAKDAVTGEVADPFGGIVDIERRVIRLVGGSERFKEDPLRMLRAIRFSCQLGFYMKVNQFYPERLTIISQERIRDELVKILATSDAERGIRLLIKFGLMEYIIPEFLELGKIKDQGRHHVKDAFEHSMLVFRKGVVKRKSITFRLACLLHDIGKPDTYTRDRHGVHFYSHHSVGAAKAEVILKRLRFSSDEVKKVCTLIDMHMQPVMLHRLFDAGQLKPRVIRRLIRRAGADGIQELLDLVECDMRSTVNPRGRFIRMLRQMVDECLEEEPETMVSPLDGNEIMELLELSPGEQIGSLKKLLTEMVLDDRLAPGDKEGARQVLLAEARLWKETA